jgi:hypothetical protein
MRHLVPRLVRQLVPRLVRQLVLRLVRQLVLRLVRRLILDPTLRVLQLAWQAITDPVAGDPRSLKLVSLPLR